MALDTYRDADDAEADRAQQIELLNALGAAARALRRDECSAWAILGQTGRIYTWGDPDRTSWVMLIACRSTWAWTAAKKALAFCTVTQDGDDEGSLRLRMLPTLDQAVIIRRLLGIPKRREYSPETLERMKERLAPWTGAKSAQGSQLQPVGARKVPAST